MRVRERERAGKQASKREKERYTIAARRMERDISKESAILLVQT